MMPQEKKNEFMRSEVVQETSVQTSITKLENLMQFLSNFRVEHARKRLLEL